MRRLVPATLTLALLTLAFASADPAVAGEKKKPKEPLEFATAEEVAEALAQFKIDFKARGIPKEDVISQRNWAMKKIAKLQHPAVIETLAKVTKSRNKDLRTLAVIYLGDQGLHPHLAAQPILATMKKYKRDRSMVMTGLQSLCLLKYLGARKEIAALLKHKDIAVQKTAIAAVGAIKDLRLLKEVLVLLGVDADETSDAKNDGGIDGGPENANKSDGDPKAASEKSSGGESDGGGESETVDEGYSWDGVDVFVPEGEDPEAAVRAAQEKNRSAAEAAARGKKSSSSAAPATGSAPASKAPSAGNAGSGSSTSGMGGSSSRGSGAKQRGASELIPTILLTLKELTGVKFSEPGSIKEWLGENAAGIRKRQSELNDAEKAQKKADEKALKQAKETRAR